MNEEINKKDYKPLTPFKGWVLENFPFIEADFDAITNYELMCKVTEYLNNVIYNQNQVQDLSDELVDGYNDLLEYVNNYFDNLNLQSEVNIKLDEMAQDGSLTQLIKDYIDPIQDEFETDVSNTLEGMQSQINGIASGSPAGVYATVSALTSADPNHNKIYLVLDDGKWYYYNTATSSWTAGGVYQSTTLADDSIEIKKVDDTFKKQINIVPFPTIYQGMFQSQNYDPSDFTSGISSNNKRVVTYPIDIKEGDILYVNNLQYQVTMHLFRNDMSLVAQGTKWYNSNKYNFEEALKISFQFQKNDNTNLAPDDINYNDIRIVRNGKDLYPLNENEIELPLTKLSFIENSNLYSNYHSGKINFTLIPNVNKMSFNLGCLRTDTYANNIIVGEDNDYYYSAFFGQQGNNNIRKYSKTNTSGNPIATSITIDSTLPDYAKDYKTVVEIKDNILYIQNANRVVASADLSSLNINYILGFITAESLNNTANAFNINCNFNIDTKKEYNNEVDLLVFAGQSNIAGRGDSTLAPAVNKNAGYEFKAITNQNRLFIIEEPFGVAENNANGINDGNMKTGSLVSSFVNYYYDGKVPVIGVSASKGGSSISQWQNDGVYLPDLITRFNNAVSYLNNKGYKIRHKYVIWCQGETDGDNGTNETTYKSLFESMLTSLLNAGIDKLLMIRIGNYNGTNTATIQNYKNIIEWQTDIAKTNENVIMISTDFAGMKERDLMKDQFHYYQAGYNECGMYAGINANIYASTQKEATMYDTEYNNLYYSHKN